jgi:hypothetical protein
MHVRLLVAVTFYGVLMAGCASAAYGSAETGSGTTLVAGARQGFWNSSARVWVCQDSGKQQCSEVEVDEEGK